MVPFNYDTDPTLANFTNDYINDILGETERLVFKEYLIVDKPLAAFVDQVKKGKQVLRKAFQVKAADDFEEKLFKRIAQEKEEDKPKENYTSA